MQKWEYLFVVFKWETSATLFTHYDWRLESIDGQAAPKGQKGLGRIDAFRDLGMQGWELIEYTAVGEKYLSAIFKRPKE